MRKQHVKQLLLITAISLLTHISSGQNINFDNTSGDGIWGNAQNWDTDTLPIASDNPGIGSNLTARILAAGAVGDILRVGSSNATLGGPGTLVISNTTATLSVQELRISNGNNSGLVHFVEGQIDATQSGGVEAIYVGYDTNAPATLIMGSPGANDADTILNYRAGRFEIARTDNAAGTFIQESGIVDGNENFIIGQNGVNNKAVVQLNGGSFTTTAQLNMNNGDGELHIHGGSLSVNDLQMSNNANNTSQVNIASGSFTITDQLNDRNGRSEMTLSGTGELRLTGNTNVREVEYFTQSDSSVLTISMVNPTNGISAPLNIMNQGVFTNTPMIALTPPALNNAVIDTWDGGIGEWNDDGSKWDLGLIPAHAAGVYSGSVFRVITSPNAIAGKTNITSEAGWTVLHPDENNVDLQRSGSSLPGGATAAVISNLGSAVTRTNDLRIAPESGVDATSLTISTGSLTFTDTAELMIGGNSAGTVNQNGGTVEINDDLRFGPSTNSAFGGTYNLNSGNMNIRGQIIESSEPVDSAQFHVDGGVLNMVNGGNILVQSFRTGNAPASTGTYTTQGDLYTTGTAVAGYEGNGTLVIGDPTHTFSARDIVVGGLFNGTDASSGRFEIPNGTLETRTGSLRIGGNATGGTSVGTVGDVIVGNGTPGSEPVVRISGGNTEVGHGGTGTLTINSGSYSQLSNNIVIGQSGSSTGIMTVNGGVVQNNGELNLNDGVGTFIMNGGDMSVGNINQSRNTSSTIFINGGVFNNRGNLNDRDGISELNIGGTGTLIFSGSPANRRTDNFSMGTNGVLRFNLVNTNAGVSAPLTINSSNILFTGTPSIEVDASTLPANITSTTLTNYWVGDTGTWDTAGSNWDRGTIPGASGLIEAPFSFTAISTSTNNSLIGADLLSSGTPDWQVNLPDPQTVEMVLTNGAIGIGVMATAITNTNDDVTRNANLLIANEVGADTTQLEILDGNLTLGGTNDLIIGGAEQGLVSQHQGVVTIGGNIIYGPTGAQGGEYNFNGGILHVNAIQETVPEVNRAQFHYNGGTLNVSNEVLVQRFSVAEANATNTYVMDIDLTTTGTLAVGGNTNSVGHLTLNNTNLVLDINDIGVAQNQNARGTLVVDGVTLDPNTINIAQNNDAQGTFHMLSGNVSVNGSNMTLGQNNNAQGTSIIESGVLAIRNRHNIAGDSQNDTNTVGTIIMGLSGGGTNSPLITVQGGNTELGHGGEGTFTMESGRYQQLSNNLVLGQGDRGVAVFNMNGGFLDLTNDMNFNRGNGTFNHNGGDVRTRDLRLGASNGTFPNQNATYNYSGNGILDPRHLRVAESENGTFNHEAGAFATRGHLLIAGNNGNASQTRDGSTGVYNFGINAASMLTVAGGNFEVGRTTGASGTFNHLAGDVMVSDQNLNGNDHNLVIGQYVNSRGTYNLTDPNGTLTLNRFDDGGLLNFNAGIGVLNQDAGTVTLNGGLINLGNNAAASNQYNMAGGSLIIRSVVINTGLDFRNNGHDTFNLSGGLLDLGGGRIHYGNRTGTNAFNFTGGTLMDVAIFDGDLDQQGGTLSIGGSIGTMLIQQGAQQGMSGNYSLAAAGTLDIEIDGTSGAGVTNGHDRLTVNGDVNLDGNLNLQVNYTINHGDSFVILENAGPNPVNGTFAGLPEGASLPNGLIISYTGGDGNDVELSAAELVGVVPAPQGGGALQLNFSGLPGTNYVVEYADNTVFPPYTWISLGNLTAGPDGAFSINRTPATASELYRARTP